VAFSLVQEGRELRVSGSEERINISVPFRSSHSNESSVPCVGTPNASDVSACVSVVQCRWWDGDAKEWSTGGCTTIADATGSYTCSCTHLTEFVVFEFPTSADDLLSTALTAATLNSLSKRALECAVDPSRSWRAIPVVWYCIIVVLVLFVVLLSQAVFRDRVEIRNTLLLIAGRKKAEEVRKKAEHARKKLTRQGTTGSFLKRQATGSLSRRSPSVPKRGSFMRQPSITGFVRPKRSTCKTDSSHKIAPIPPTAADDPLPPAASAALVQTPLAGVLPVLSHVVEKNDSKVDELGPGAVSKPNPFGAGKPNPFGADKPKAPVPGKWNLAKATVQGEVNAAIMSKRWHKDVDSNCKRICLACTQYHTLLAGIVYRGSAGYTRAQTMMVLVNSFTFELFMLCLTWPSPTPAPADGSEQPVVTFNVVGIIVSSTLASIITVPAMVSFAFLYDPIIFVRIAKWALRATFCWPRWLLSCCARRRSARVADEPTMAPTASRVAAPEDDVVDENATKALVENQEVADAASTSVTTIPTVTTPATVTTSTSVQPADDLELAPATTPRVDLLESASAPPPSPPPSPGGGAPDDAEGEERISHVSTDERGRQFSYESLNEVFLKASLIESWKRKDWPAVKKILFGWSSNVVLFYLMLAAFLFYSCELFEPRNDPGNPVSGTTDELVIGWILAAFQRFILHEPTLILAAKGLPILFASAFCTNCCGETIVNLLSVIFGAVLECIKQIKA